MSKEIEIARNLISNSQLSVETEHFGICIAKNVVVVPPYSDCFLMSDWSYPLPNIMYESFSNVSDMLEEGVPEKWVRFLTSASEERFRAGCKQPLDICSAAFFTLIENKQRAAELDISQFEYISGLIDFSDKDRVKAVIDQIIDDDVLSGHMMQTCKYLVPDSPGNYVNYDIYDKVAESLQLDSGLVFDLACGTGENTQKLSNNGSSVVAVDRQYHPDWYDECWRNLDGCSFVRADLKSLPFPDCVAKAAIITNAVSYINEDSLEKVLTEAKRVVVDNGVLMVAPQYSDDFSGWAFYRKVKFGDSYEFVCTSANEIITENDLKEVIEGSC